MPHNISRRNFFRLATGSLLTLPTVAGGFMVPPSIAYAEEPQRGEANGGSADGVTARIVVVSASEVGFCVVDMADGGKTKVEGATVTVLSRYNNKSVRDKTDKDGVVVFDIKNLSENPDELDVNKLDEYAFNASITIECKGYRDCKLKLVRVEGATPLLVPTRSTSDGLPYPISVSFNDWDVLYTQSEFTQTPKNTDKHALKMEWTQLQDGTATISLRERGGTKVFCTQTKQVSRSMTASFTEQFLKTGAANALPTDVAFDVDLTQNGNTFSVPLQLTVTKGAAEDPQGKEELKLKPLNYASGSKTAIDLKWPDGVPLVSGGSLKSWSPDLPVNVYINPFGYFQITAKTPSWGYKKDNSGSDKQGWGKYPRKSASEQFDKMLSSANKMSTATAKAYAAEGNVNQIDLAKSFSLMGNAQVMAAAQWSTSKGTFQGALGGQIFIGCNASITENFFAGPIPVLITFAIDASMVISLGCGIYSLKDPDNPNEGLLDAAFDFSRWKFDYTSTVFTVSINVTPSLSVGVGIRGIASISVMGRFTLALYFGFTHRGELDSDVYTLPHNVFGFSAQISLVLHLFLFTKTFALKDWKYRDFYDSWKGGLQPMADELEGDALKALADENLTSLLGQMDIITNDMLYDTHEHEGTLSGQASDGLGAQSDGPDEIFDWETMRQDDIVEPLADGTTITYAVYKMVTSEDKPDGLDALTAQGMEEQKEEVAAPADEVAASADTASNDTTTESDTDLKDDDSLVLLDANGSNEPQDSAEDLVVVSERAEEPEDEDSDEREVKREEPSRVRLSLGSSVVYEQVHNVGIGLEGLADEDTTSILPDPKTLQLGREGGIRPTSDKVIASKVFGDPRVKVINVNPDGLATGEDYDYARATCSFRIASVLVDNVPRTRVVITFLNVTVNDNITINPWYYHNLVGKEVVVDFDINDVPGVSHKDLYDYDFDLVFSKHTERNFEPMWNEWREYKYERVHLVIVSGRRPEGDSTSIASAATDLVFTYLCFETRGIAISPPPLYARRSILASEVLGKDDMFHCISSLQCVADATEDSNVITMGFLDRMAATPEGVLSDDDSIVTVKPALLFVNVRSGNMVVPKRGELDEKIGSISNSSAFELALSPKIEGYYTLSIRGPKRTHFFVLDVNSSNATLANVWIGGVLDASMHLVPWPQMNCFLTSYPRADYVETLAQNYEDPDALDRSQWVLQTARWNTQTALPNLAELVFEPIGPSGFNFSNFGINSNGTFIFWPQGKEGDDGRVFAEDGSFEQNEDVPVYQIMACRIRDGKFSDPFIAADVTHDMNSMEIVSTRSNVAPLEVLSNELLSPAGDDVYYASNLWYTSIPNLRCATAIGCECPVPLVSPGGTQRFNVSVRNDGNVYLSGCTLQLCVHEGDEVSEVAGSSAAITFDKDSLQPSLWNPTTKDDTLQNVEDDWSLPPGKTALYRVDVAIPAKWQGEKLVSFVARDAVMAKDGGLNSLADDEEEVVYQDFSIEPGTYKVTQQRTSLEQDPERTYMQAISVTESVATGTAYADAPVRVATTAQTEATPAVQEVENAAPTSNANGTANVTTAAPSATATPTTSQLAKTGDHTSSALSAGVALAGAALLAYSKRRVQNEEDQPR